MVDEKQKRTFGAQVAVLEYLQKRANVTVFVNDMVQDLGLNKNTVQKCVSNLRYQNKAEARERLIVEIAGQAWTWRTGSIAGVSGPLYEVAFQTKSGRVYVQDEDGEIFPLGNRLE